MENPLSIKVLEQCRISPPSGSVPQTSVHLTYFDLGEVGIDPPVHCLYFYKHECSKTHFMQSILPNMKHSLSLTLQHFFSLAGNLTWFPESTVPEIIYHDGDSVSFTVVESDFDFDHLCGNNPRDAITLFPNTGICVGLTISHTTADGIAFNHFMRFWASVCSFGGEITKSVLSDHALPSYNRTKISDPYGIETAHINGLKKINIYPQSFTLPITPTDPNDRLVATFVMDAPTIDKLKKWVLRRITERNKVLPCFNVTSVVATLACVWVCWSKALDGDKWEYNSKEHLMLPVDCRARIDPALPLTYFGNCFTFCFRTISKNDLFGEDGIVIAAELIGKALQTFCKAVLDDCENLFPKFSSIASQRIFGVSGSPRMRSYEVDFGWGTPKKVELISSTATYGWVTLSEHGDREKGSLEIGVAMKKPQMDVFASLFENTLSSL
ncbi:hypothetical protein GIB67_042335 [Kingdonia uniflora]|uniref:Uncharacterized protein n=1 Tax=Kingdonia uniflora TaxID=39325 RepID=A0A7J7LEE6_9MAGN|nr:hypothetical protein GIB67_042335 [Kingdonia uniflora]